jgi:hypothetical protein
MAPVHSWLEEGLVSIAQSVAVAGTDNSPKQPVERILNVLTQRNDDSEMTAQLLPSPGLCSLCICMY